MNKKGLFAKMLSIMLVFSSVLSSPGYALATLNETTVSSSEQEIAPLLQDDIPILSEETNEPEYVDANVSESTSSSEQEVAPSTQEETPILSGEEVESEYDELVEETTQTTTQSEEASEGRVATTDDLVPSRSSRINPGELTVQVTSPQDDDNTQPGIQTKMQTFVDSKLNTNPPDFVLGLQVTNGATDLSGTYIEIPLDCVPDGVTAPYGTYDLSNVPIYTFDESGSTLEGVIGNCEITETGGIPRNLRLYFKTAVNHGVYNLVLRFKLNQEYYGKIPPKGMSWIVKPSYYNGVNKDELEIVEILTTANPTESVDIARQSPSGENFGGTSVQMLCTLNNLNPYEAWLKSGSYSYVAVPVGFTAKGSITTGGAKTDLMALLYEGPTLEEIDGVYYQIYKKYHGNTKDTWTNWDHNSIGNTFNRLYLEVTPPSDFAVGSQFKVYYGSELTRENGEEKTLDEKLRKEVSYKKTESLAWVLEGNGYNAHSSGRQASCGIENGAVGNAVQNSDWMHAGYSTYNHNSSTRNMGMGIGKNVRLELYSTNAGSPRLNYNQVEVSIAAGPYPDRISGPETGTRSYFKVEFEIENALTHATRDSGVSKSGNQTFKITPTEMPVLEPNEFIHKVIVTPMGADGTQEGDWPPGNIIGVKYQPKAWPDQKWPDGTDVSDRPSTVTMKWTLYSDNEMQPVKDGTSRSMIYLPQNSVAASAQMISTDSQNRGPGDTVTYTLNGYNDYAKINNPWVDPYLIIAVPKVLQLKDPGLPKIYEDLVVNGNGTKEVFVNKMPQSSNSNDYDFYELQLDGISQKAKSNDPAFRIPLEFQVADATLPRAYNIPFVIVSQKHKIAFSQVVLGLNNLSSDIINPDELGFDGANKYTAITSRHTALTIVQRPRMSADISVKSETVDWSNQEVVSVSPNDQVEMKLKLKNTGNTTFKGAKLYNILPYQGDGRGSNGEIIFTGIDGLDGLLEEFEVWYSTADPETLPSYDLISLATFDPAEQDSVWSKSLPALNEITAFYINFKENKIKPGEELAPIIKFEIPEAPTESTAYNQFKYSVSDEATSAQVMQAIGPSKGFSTEALNLEFTTGVDESITVNNMPANVSKMREQGSNTIDIPSGLENTPTRTGYDFLHWKDKNSGSTYLPEDEVTFADGVNKITLEAQWKAIDIKVTYSENLNPVPDPSGQVWGERIYNYDHVLVELDLPTAPVREGYRFKGWSTNYVSETADFGEGTKINFTTDTTVYAVWEELYTLTVSQQTAGAFADKTLVFDYSVTFKNTDGTPYRKEIKYKRSGGATGVFPLDTDGKGTFSLGEGESISFQYFAEENGVQYEIVQTKKDLYQPYVNATIDSDGKVSGGTKTNIAEGTIGDDKKHDAEKFINERADVPITGVDIDDISSQMMVWISILGLLLFGWHLQRKKADRKD